MGDLIYDHRLNQNRSWMVKNSTGCIKKNATHRNKAKPKNTQKLPTHHFMKNGILSYLIFGAKSYFAILGHFWFFFFKATV